MSGRGPKVLLAMSGGVDSSVAAALLLRAGYEVVGCFMRLGSPGETLDELIEDAEPRTSENGCCTNGSNGSPLPHGRGSDGELPGRRPGRALRIGHQGCCSINDASDARLVAAKLGIPFYVCNFKKDFSRIIDYFVGEYNAGRTPNPCVRCNDWLKFGKLHEYARQIDAQFVASGHYARIECAPKPGHSHAPALRGAELALRGADPAFPRLMRGVDHDKDQSYVLFGIPRKRLSEILLPIGSYRKSEVRRIARELDLPVFDKPDSQEICFVPDNDYAGLVAQRTPEHVTPGPIVDIAGRQLGEHRGHQHYTVGQRKGIRIAADHPLYVIEKDAMTNTIVVGSREALLADTLRASEANWLIDPAPDWIECTAKIRYNTQPQPACVRVSDDDDEIEVVFSEPQHAIAPGQAVVCYGGDDGEQVICGGWITEAG